LTVFASHLAFDFIKTKVGKDTTGPFVLDQLAHIAVVIALACIFPAAASNGWWPAALQGWEYTYYVFLTVVSGFVLVVPAGGILIGKLTAPIRKEIEEESKILVGKTDPGPPENGVSGTDYLTDGLTNGGMYIGWLERFLAMLLILIGQPTGIGFLIAAKSILRFGEIKESRHRKVAEYIIIGTFLSFGWALLMSVAMQKGIDHWTPKESPESKPLKIILQQPNENAPASTTTKN
jgi:hypothetical protein